MRIKKRGDKKMLHEHEAFLFGFVLIFILGGFIFWNYDAVALDFSIDDSSVSDGDSINFGEVILSETVTKSLIVENNGEDVVVLSEIEVWCSVNEDEEEDEDVFASYEDCPLTNNFDETITLYPNESFVLTFTFDGEEAGDYRGTINIVTTDGINSFSFEVEVTSDGEDEEEAAEDEEEEAEDLLERLIDFLTGGYEEEEVEEEDEDGIGPITAIQNNVGLTTSSLDFGDVRVDDQKTMRLEIENMGEELLEISQITREHDFVVVTSSPRLIASEERSTIEVTCSPLERGSFSGVVGINGIVEIGYSCNAIGEFDLFLEEIIDVEPPVVSISSPTEGVVSGDVNIMVSVSDSGGVASVKAYINQRLVGVVTSLPPYQFSVDTPDFENGLSNIVVRALDNSGNLGSDYVSVIIRNEDEEEEIILTRELMFMNVPGEFNFQYRDDGTYKSVVGGVLMEQGEKFDLRLDTFTDLGEIYFEFPGALISSDSSLDLDNLDVDLIMKGGDVEIIDIDYDVLESLIDSLNVNSVVMPMKKYEGYENLGNLQVYFYYDDGRTIDITDEIISAKEEGDLIYVRIPVEIING